MYSKIFKLFATILVLTFVITACAPAAPVATTAPVEPAVKKVIGFSVYDMQYGFFQDMEKGTKEAATAAGYDYILVDEKSSESTMVSATIDLINQGIDALIISPFKPDALGPIVDAAKAKGIPVVVDDIGGGGSAYDAIVISNNEEGGVMAAVQMDKLISAAGKPKKVASITCEASAVYAARRNVGFEAKIKELGYEVVATLSGNSQQEQGYKVMQDILTANPDVAGVFSCNDPMAVGAAQAVKDSGKSGATDIYVIGFNADQIALESIKAGDMAATVQQVPFEMGKTTVALATKLMNGEKLTYDNAEAREIFVPVNLITAESLGVKPAVKKVIGFSVYDMQYGFFQDMEKGTKEAATAAGYDYILVDEKSSESTMVSATIDLINQGIDALIISPFKPDALGPIVDAAKAKGIPVVVDDIGGGGSAYDAIVISNNEEGGVMAAVQMDKLISAAGKPKKVASITCEASAVYAARRNVGFEAKIKELGYEVVATLSGNSQQEQGYKVMQDILTANPDVAGVFSCNDPMAVGAAQAVKDSGKSGATDIYVIGFNADQIALESIKAGDMAATVQQVPFEMGKMTVDLATKLMNGEKLTYDNAEAREIFVPVNLITVDNLPK